MTSIAVAASVFLVVSAGAGRGEQRVASDFNESKIPALISLYISCDLMAEFITPPLDAAAVHQLDTPVSREGARLQKESRRTRGWGMVRVPLMVDESSLRRMQDNHFTPIDVWKPNPNIRLLSARIQS